KKSAARLLGAAELSGTPSQLISRRPVANVLPTPLLAPPRSVRNWSTIAWMAVGSAPAALRTTAAGTARSSRRSPLSPVGLAGRPRFLRKDVAAPPRMSLNQRMMQLREGVTEAGWHLPGGVRTDPPGRNRGRPRTG